MVPGNRVGAGEELCWSLLLLPELSEILPAEKILSQTVEIKFLSS
jgi:hypothetical protein